MPPNINEKAILLRLSAEDHAAFKACADGAGVALAAWCRMALKAEAAKALRDLKKGQMK